MLTAILSNRLAVYSAPFCFLDYLLLLELELTNDHHLVPALNVFKVLKELLVFD